MDSLCRVRNKIMYVLSWRTVSVLTRVLFLCLFPSLLRNSRNKHQNNSPVSAETARHSNTCIHYSIHSLHLQSSYSWWSSPASSYVRIQVELTMTEEYYRNHYSDVMMSPMASQIIGVSIVYSTVCSGADQRKHQSSAPLAFVRGIPQWPVNSPHKGSVTRKMFPFDDVIMKSLILNCTIHRCVVKIRITRRKWNVPLLKFFVTPE